MIKLYFMQKYINLRYFNYKINFLYELCERKNIGKYKSN